MINGKDEVLGDSTLNVSDLLKLQKVSMPEYVTVEVNGEIIHNSDYKSRYLKDGDKLNYLYYMGGGESRHPSSHQWTSGHTRVEKRA